MTKTFSTLHSVLLVVGNFITGALHTMMMMRIQISTVQKAAFLISKASYREMTSTQSVQKCAGVCRIVQEDDSKKGMQNFQFK